MKEYKDEKHGITAKIDFDLINEFFAIFKTLDDKTLSENDSTMKKAIEVVKSRIKVNKNNAVEEWALIGLIKSFSGIECSDAAKAKMKKDLVEYAIMYDNFYSFSISKAYITEYDGFRKVNIDVEKIGTLSVEL